MPKDPNVKVIAGGWETRNGTVKTMGMDAYVLQQLEEVVKAEKKDPGGVLFARRRSQNAMQSTPNAPGFYFEYHTRAKVQEFEKSKPQNKNAQPQTAL